MSSLSERSYKLSGLCKNTYAMPRHELKLRQRASCRVRRSRIKDVVLAVVFYTQCGLQGTFMDLVGQYTTKLQS